MKAHCCYGILNDGVLCQCAEGGLTPPSMEYCILLHPYELDECRLKFQASADQGREKAGMIRKIMPAEIEDRFILGM